MDMLVSVIAFIAVVIFMIINLSLYHKIFRVVYFDLGRGCFVELFFSWLVAMFEVGIIFGIGKYVLGLLLKILGFVGIALAVGLAIVLVAYIVRKIVQMVNDKANAEETERTDNDSTKKDQVMGDTKESEEGEKNFELSNVGVDMEKIDIELTEVQNNSHTIVCTACGKRINKDAKFCKFCGERIVI